MAALGKDPKSPFGSNATAIGGDASTTGRGMMLGNPHFPWRGRYRFTQQQLTIPGQYDVAGASLIGSPVVNIGWNKDVAWSHTVSTAYRFTPYEYQTLGTGPHDLPDHRRASSSSSKRVVKVTVKNADGSLSTVTKNLYRTDQGYVLDDPATLMNWTPDQLLRDPRRQRRAAAHDRHVPRHGQGHQRPRPARAPGQGRRHAVGEHHRRRPQRQRAVRRPLGRAQRLQRPRPEVHDARSAGCSSRSPGCPASTAPAPTSDCAWGTDADAQRPGIFGPKNLPADRAARLGDERQRLLLAAQPGAEARGLRPHHRLREVPAHAAHADGRPLRRSTRLAKGKISPTQLCAASSTRTG